MSKRKMHFWVQKKVKQGHCPDFALCGDDTRDKHGSIDMTTNVDAVNCKACLAKLEKAK